MEPKNSDEQAAKAADQRSASEPPKAPARRFLKNLVRVVLGVVVGLAAAEGMFHIRDGGAFPHLNVYVSDRELGVRLQPFATERVRFSSPKNPVTSVRINADGYRGDDWPAASPDEIVVVGDSQAFGLGVEESETFEREIERSLVKKAYVRNLGVPTYGPGEYNAVLEESLSKRPAKIVVWVANMANDLFEAERPNKERHLAWDGWAVRKENAPATSTQFPGRGFLYTDSHAFYALRRWLYDEDKSREDQGVPSEGTWKDVAGDAVISEKEHERDRVEAKRLAALQRSQAKYAGDEAERAARELDSKIIEEDFRDDTALLRDQDADYANPNFVPKEQVFEAGRRAPGDIVTEHFGESSRDIRVSAELIRRGAALRAKVEKAARDKAVAQKRKDVLDLFQKRDDLAHRAAEVAAAPLPKPVPLSPLRKQIAAAKAICDKHGARLIVVALPIDVQVDKAEWAKYGAPAEDMEATKILNADVVAAAEYVDADGFDAGKTLAAAEPGAFLDGDIHMTPKGHRALGQALAKLIERPHTKIPGEGLPAFRSAFPRESEWTGDTEIAVAESDPAGCETKRVREWLGIFCHTDVRGVQVTAGREVTAGAMKGQALLIAPIIPGQDVRATFAYAQRSRGFSASLAKEGDAPEVAFTKELPGNEAIAGPAPFADSFCACFEKTHVGKTCATARTPPSAACASTYAADCDKMLACAEGATDARPACDDLQTNAVPPHACLPLCGPALPCAKGTCTAWQGGDVCL